MSLKEKLREELSCNDKGYLDSYKENIFNREMDQDYQNMFDKGSGGELHSKAEAVHSSSMLSYNFFHWIKDGNTFTYEDVVYSKVYFEVQMRTLSCRSNPANMDIVLEGIDSNGKRHLLFVESKFTEYLEKRTFNLSDSYKNKKNWYNKEIDWCTLIENAETLCPNHVYGEGIKQAITHLFGMYGLYGDKKALDFFNKGLVKIENIENVDIEFANFVFEPDAKLFQEEHAAYTNYEHLYTDFIRILPENKIKISILSYSDVWKIMKPQINNIQLVDYIDKRYMQYAQKK